MRFFKKFILFTLILIPLIQAEYFSTDIQIKLDSYILDNQTYQNITITSENPNNVFFMANISNKSSVENFTITIWRVFGTNQTDETDVNNVTETLRTLLQDIPRKETCDYLRGANETITKVNNTFYAMFQNIDYKSKMEVCDERNTNLTGQITGVIMERDTAKQNSLLYFSTGAIITGVLAYSAWRLPRKIRQPGIKDYADLERGGNVKW